MMNTQERLVAEAAADRRKLVTIRTISAINDIPGADLIKVACSAKGNEEMSVGNVVLDNTGTVTISRKEYEELLQSQDMLIALESAGVDNWAGYSYAMEILQEMQDGLEE